MDVGGKSKNLVFIVSQTHRLNHVVSKGRNKSRMSILVAPNSVSFDMNAVAISNDLHSADDDEHSVLGVHGYSINSSGGRANSIQGRNPLLPFI